MRNFQWFKQLLEKEGPDATWRPDFDPLVLEKAKDSICWDVEGNSYIDLCAGFGSLPLGHNNDDVKARLSQDENYIVQGLGDVYPSRFKIQLINKIHELLPSYLSRTALAVTGSQAVEFSMKTAMLASGGEGFICFDGAYHGLDLACLNLVGREEFRQPFQSWLNETKIKRLPFQCDVEFVRRALKEFRKEGIIPAGLIVEPIQGRGGQKLASKEWLQALRQVCLEEKCLLIFDEIFTGLGRSGLLSFAEQVPCDLLCLGKALGGGMPLSACVGTEAVMSAWPENQGESLFTGTYFGHPYACRVGLATLEVMVEKNTVNYAQNLGEKALLDLQQKLAGNSHVRAVRGSGLMLAIEFVSYAQVAILIRKLKSRGVILIPCGLKGECLSLTPPLNISEKILFEALAIIYDEIRLLE